MKKAVKKANSGPKGKRKDEWCFARLKRNKRRATDASTN